MKEGTSCGDILRVCCGLTCVSVNRRRPRWRGTRCNDLLNDDDHDDDEGKVVARYSLACWFVVGLMFYSMYRRRPRKRTQVVARYSLAFLWK